MKRLLPLACLLALTLTAAQAQTVLFNNGWKYLRGDCLDAESVTFDDRSWDDVGLPHSFSIPYFAETHFYTGYGWYRKTFAVKADWLKTQQIYLDFDGVFQEAEVYVNGTLAGHHRGGYTGFRVDMTPWLHAGDNVVAVRVNNLWQATLAPRAGEHVFSGGIYRDVRLVRKSRVHFDWYGICITTPHLDATAPEGYATVAVEAEVRAAEGATAEGLTLAVDLLDASGRRVARQRGVAVVDARGAVSLRLPHVNLWSPATPYLYTAVCRLYNGRHLLDEERIPFGCRWMEWTVDHGFFLNGQHLYFHGANVHQDQAGWGDAVTDAAIRRDVAMVKEAGFDMIRGSHYPHSPVFVQECDRLGLLFWSEAPFWGTFGWYQDGNWQANPYPLDSRDSLAFEQSVFSQLDDMIRIHRNSPSVFAWSMCNEVFFSTRATAPAIRSLLTRMVERTHRLDPTRVAAIGGCQRPIGPDRIDLLGDVAGYNGDGAAIPDFMHPAVPNVVTEYSTTTAVRPGNYDPGWGDLARDDMWRGVEWRSGQSLWCAFDHGSIFGPDMGQMGIIDYFRIPKRAWYWYRNEYTHVAPPEWPVEGDAAQLRLEASQRRGLRADGTDDAWLLVTVCDRDGRPLSNSPTVRLDIISDPGQFPTGRTITFAADSPIRMADGKAAITVRSYSRGRTVIRATSPGLQPAEITLKWKGGGVSAEAQRTANQHQVDGDSNTSAQHTPIPVTPSFEGGQEEASSTSLFGTLSPTFVSSSLADHQAGWATDGDAATWWQAAADDAQPTLTLDTERTILLHEVIVRFTDSADKYIKVECSTDRVQWSPVADYSTRPLADAEWTYTLPSPMRSRFVRISFLGATLPAVAEMNVRGTL